VGQPIADAARAPEPKVGRLRHCRGIAGERALWEAARGRLGRPLCFGWEKSSACGVQKVLRSSVDSAPKPVCPSAVWSTSPRCATVAADPLCIQGADRSEAWEEVADRFCMEAADRTEPGATLPPSMPTSLVMSRASSEESLDAFVEKIVERAQQVRTRPLCERATSEDGSFDSLVVLEEGTAVDS